MIDFRWNNIELFTIIKANFDYSIKMLKKSQFEWNPEGWEVFLYKRI